jgi:hypothetical protein
MLLVFVDERLFYMELARSTSLKMFYAWRMFNKHKENNLSNPVCDSFLQQNFVSITNECQWSKSVQTQKRRLDSDVPHWGTLPRFCLVQN